MSEREKVKKVVEMIAEDFDVPPPDVVIDEETFLKACGENAAGCYGWKEKTILVNPKHVTLSTILHEFAHHLQLIRSGGDPDKAYSDLDKVHCKRAHEREAKNFEKAFWYYYSGVWEKHVGRKV